MQRKRERKGGPQLVPIAVERKREKRCEDEREAELPGGG